MAGKNKNKELIKEIKGGNEHVLLYLFRKHYGDMKKVFASYRVDENEIPTQAASAIVKIWMEIHDNNFSENIDLNSYLLNTAKEIADKLVTEKKLHKKSRAIAMPGSFNDLAEYAISPQEIVAECVNVLDGGSRRVLQWRYGENYSIEQIAEKLKTDVAAAHDFLNRAFTQLSSIVKIRMEYS